MAMISRDLLAQEETWDPQMFCGSILRILRLESEQFVTVAGAAVFEGQRWDDLGASDEPGYRMSNVDCLEMRLTPDLCRSPAIESRYCVEPGDLVMTKMAPIRAALATPNLFRHPVDANLCLVRGLDVPQGFWVALCLNQRAFGDYLVRKSGAAVVPRIRADVLKSVRFPRPPAIVERLSHQVYECIEQRLQLQIEFDRFLAAVHEEIAAQMPESSDVHAEEDPLTTWYRRFPSDDIDDSLVPEHVAINGYQHRLAREAGWRSIRDFTTQRSAAATRFADDNHSVRTLQLSDVEGDLTVLRGHVRVVAAMRRVYAEALQDDEVLLSSLVSRPRVAFVGARPDQPIYPTDHWHRLRFRETPGAWAAIVNDTEIHHQLARLAIGSLQQFAPAWAIQKLVLPNVQLEIRRKWDSFLRRWQQRRVELEADWSRLMAESYHALQETHRQCGNWSEPMAGSPDEEHES